MKLDLSGLKCKNIFFKVRANNNNNNNNDVNEVKKKKQTNRENQKNIMISRTVELMHFENWFVESPLNKLCTSLFIISIMDVYAYFHLN